MPNVIATLPLLECRATAMGKMPNCGVQNAEGEMRNGMCGATVIGRDVTSRDCSYSAFYRTPCVDCVAVGLKSDGTTGQTTGHL